MLNVALSVGFCTPPVVTGTSTVLRTESNAEVPKWPSAKPTWAKLFLLIFLGWIFRKVVKESKWDFWVAGVPCVSRFASRSNLGICVSLGLETCQEKS